jgi:hypothetical protein
MAGQSLDGKSTKKEAPLGGPLTKYSKKLFHETILIEFNLNDAVFETLD